MHLGGIYVAALDWAIARQTGGVYFVRIEDTDQQREVAGAAAEYEPALAWSGIPSDEPAGTGAYGPYVQSQRSMIYMTYVREFLRAGKAYPCFSTKEELAAMADEQRALKVMTGYYGRWAPWRDAPAERVRAKLAAGVPYVVRFRSPGVGARRITYTDLIRGIMSADDNCNDVVILKSSANELRLPTYHFAHVVDDHLMRVTLVIRGDEWLSSVPVHIQLWDVAGFERPPYAHVAPLMKLEGTTRRKLSKRHDPEASIEFYIAAGYPRVALIYYLRGLANSRLADLRPISDAMREPIRLEECGTSGPLVDLVKLEDIGADVIASMPSEDVFDAILEWAEKYDRELAAIVKSQRSLAVRALDIERVGVNNPRKDLHKWSDFRGAYGYFFNELFAVITNPGDARFEGIDPAVVRRLCAQVLRDSRGAADEWPNQIRTAAAACGFAPTARAFKDAPSTYVGSTREAFLVIRVLLTGSTRSQGLHFVADVLGEVEVKRRLGAVLAVDDGGQHLASGS